MLILAPADCLLIAAAFRYGRPCATGALVHAHPHPGCTHYARKNVGLRNGVDNRQRGCRYWRPAMRHAESSAGANKRLPHLVTSDLGSVEGPSLLREAGSPAREAKPLHLALARFAAVPRQLQTPPISRAGLRLRHVRPSPQSSLQLMSASQRAQQPLATTRPSCIGLHRLELLVVTYV